MNAKEYFNSGCRPSKHDFIVDYTGMDMIKFAEDYHQHKLSEITEEEMEGIAQDTWDMYCASIGSCNFTKTDAFITGFKSGYNFLKDSDENNQTNSDQ